MITKTITTTTYQKNRAQGFCYNIGWNNNRHSTSPVIGNIYYLLLIATCYMLDATYQKNNNSKCYMVE